MKTKLFPFITACLISGMARAQIHTIPVIKLSESDFGGVGLWQTPTARMKPDGQFDIDVSHAWPYTRGNIVFQPLPWAEGIVRYTDISNVKYGVTTSDQSTKDKSVDVKFRLAKEGFYLPAIAVGFRDFGGTGLFSSEYINATKRFGLFDITLGIAWGSMAGGGKTGDTGNISNPLCSLSNTFCRRMHDTGMGGTVSWGDFFSGRRASLFGGIEYQTPYAPLRLKLEYDPNDYQHEAAQYYPLPQKSHWNMGAVYRLFKIFDLSVAYERGDTVMVGLDFSTNFNHPESMPKIDTAPMDLVPPPKRGSDQSRSVTTYTTDWDKVVKHLNIVAGFQTSAIYQQGNHLILTGRQRRYRDPYMAASRVGYVLYDDALDDYQTVTIINQAHGLLFDEISISRKQLEQMDEQRLIPFDERESESQLADIEVNCHPKYDALHHPIWKANPSRINYYIQPALTQSIGGPDGFYLYRILLQGGATYEINQNLLLTGIFSYDFFDNMDKFKYEPPPSPLPRVRSNIRRYLTTSPFALNTFQLNYFKQLSRSWYGQIYGGYLEQMFAGVGAEVLFKPSGSRVAIGADINHVQQRDFNVGFDLLPYTVTTGHIVLYYQWPIYHILSKISVGQYLAGDRGVTIDLSRQFHSGIIIGGFATFTNVSAQQFGEGSFNKGIYLKIPLDIFSLTSTTRTADLAWTPLTRDGGQMLERKYELYDVVSSDSH